MEEQLNIFDVFGIERKEEENSNDCTEREKLKCFQTELKNVQFLADVDLFSGFDSIKAITFSYDIGFVNSIMEMFQYGEIILGADFLVQKDMKLTALMEEVFTDSYEAVQSIGRYERLKELMREESVEFRSPSFVLDHRKIYLLKADDGRTRVITTSANMSKRAWNGNQMEFYTYDDSIACYEEYQRDFNVMWENSHLIPYSVVSSKKSDDFIEGNPILKGVKETGKTIVLKQELDEQAAEEVRYTIDHEAIREQYKMLINGLNTKGKGGMYEIVPETVEKIKLNQKKMEIKRKKIEVVSKEYPKMDIDYGTKEVRVNGELLNLHPTEEEIRNDINQFLTLFNNFDTFVGDTSALKRAHFKLINAIFSSPFNAKMRCTCRLRNISTLSLPLFLLVASSTANCGKTFTIRATLKMMTGLDLQPFNQADCKKDFIREVQVGQKCIPVFIDELDNRFLAHIKDIIKSPESCEDQQMEEQPMLIFASNDVLEPDEILRKRMIFLKFEGSLPSTVDQSAYKGIGNAIIGRLGSGLYREYFRRMLDLVVSELNYIINGKNIPDDYYPDVMKMSSDTLIQLFEDYGYAVPEYMEHLTWYKDYSVNATWICDNAIDQIAQLYRNSRRLFTISKEKVTITLGISKETTKRCQSWKNVLPNEMKTEYISGRENNIIVLDRKELEKRLGYKLGRFHRIRE